MKDLAKIKPHPVSPKQTTAAESYNRIRNHAAHLYDAFAEKFRICQCDPHKANLPVQKLNLDTASRPLKVVFENPVKCNPSTWTWLELEFELIESQGETDNNGNSVSVRAEVRVGEFTNAGALPGGGLGRLRGGCEKVSRSKRYLISP